MRQSWRMNTYFAGAAEKGISYFLMNEEARRLCLSAYNSMAEARNHKIRVISPRELFSEQNLTSDNRF
jgi:hypothetical protein